MACEKKIIHGPIVGVSLNLPAKKNSPPARGDHGQGSGVAFPEAAIILWLLGRQRSQLEVGTCIFPLPNNGKKLCRPLGVLDLACGAKNHARTALGCSGLRPESEKKNHSPVVSVESEGPENAKNHFSQMACEKNHSRPPGKFLKIGKCEK